MRCDFALVDTLTVHTMPSNAGTLVQGRSVAVSTLRPVVGESTRH